MKVYYIEARQGKQTLIVRSSKNVFMFTDSKEKAEEYLNKFKKYYKFIHFEIKETKINVQNDN